jgi:hypothetical protein
MQQEFSEGKATNRMRNAGLRPPTPRLRWAGIGEYEKPILNTQVDAKVEVENHVMISIYKGCIN